MAILNILTAPDPILKTRAEPVSLVDDNVRKIMDDMLETMYHDPAVGLAANQVGILKRIIVLDLKDDDEAERPANFYPLCMANPEIIELSEEKVEGREGCLSLPNQRLIISRPEKIKLKYSDYNNQEQELSTGGWLARAIQHEIDHLDGKLAIDYLSKLKRDMVLRKLKKIKRLQR